MGLDVAGDCGSCARSDDLAPNRPAFFVTLPFSDYRRPVDLDGLQGYGSSCLMNSHTRSTASFNIQTEQEALVQFVKDQVIETPATKIR